jgi:hypothetical protein
MTIHWRKSSYSGGANDDVCVELGRIEDGVGVRDSKNPEAGHLAFTSSEFGVLLSWIKQQPERYP